jgi:chromosome segregation ATPase
MGAFSFLTSFGRAKANDAVQAGIDALVRWDPKGASKAEMMEMEKHLDDLGKRVAAARNSFKVEAAEYDQVAALYNQRYAAAQKLEEQVAAETDPARKASLEKSLGVLLNQLEKQQPQLEQELKDKVDAEELLRRLESTYSDAADKLRNAREDLERAQREMARAQAEKERAQEMAEAARQAAGLSRSTSSLNVALEAMQRQAEKTRQEAEAARMKADALKVSEPEKEDENIAAAMRAAAGRPAPAMSASERLAALKPKA